MTSAKMCAGKTCRIILFFIVAALTVSTALAERVDDSLISPFDIHLNDSLLKPKVESSLMEASHNFELLFGETPSIRAEVYIASDLTSFERLIGGNFPDWGAAAAIPEKNRIVIKSPSAFRLNRSLDELLGHELSHLLLHRRTGGNMVPRWIDEGLAILISSEWGWSDNLAMSKTAVFGQFISLANIDNVNAFSQGSAHIAYAESYLAVNYLIESYGISALNELLDSLRSNASYDDALLVSTGSNYSDFDQEFRVYLHERFNILTLFMDTSYFWLVLAFILILGGILKIRRKQAYYSKWEKEEELHSTDFDYGDPENPEEIDGDEQWRD